MPFKSNVQPYCRCCGKPVAKTTEKVYFGPTNKMLNGAYFAVRSDDMPLTKEDAQRLLNEKVVSVKYYDPEKGTLTSGVGSPKHVESVTTWDGESYKDEFFCSDPCAVQMAYAFAAAGYSCKAYTAAMEARKAG